MTAPDLRRLDVREMAMRVKWRGAFSVGAHIPAVHVLARAVAVAAKAPRRATASGRPIPAAGVPQQAAETVFAAREFPPRELGALRTGQTISAGEVGAALLILIAAELAESVLIADPAKLLPVHVYLTALAILGITRGSGPDDALTARTILVGVLADRTAPAAIQPIVGHSGFAAILAPVRVAVGIARIAVPDAGAVRASDVRNMVHGASHLAAAAVGRAAIQACFATVGVDSVAVRKSEIAIPENTHSVDAKGARVGEVADRRAAEHEQVRGLPKIGSRHVGRHAARVAGRRARVAGAGRVTSPADANPIALAVGVFRATGGRTRIATLAGGIAGAAARDQHHDEHRAPTHEQPPPLLRRAPADGPLGVCGRQAGAISRRAGSERAYTHRPVGVRMCFTCIARRYT